MQLDKYIRPDGTTYWALQPYSPDDKLFIESLDPADVSPKKNWLPWALLIGAGIWFYSRK